MKPQEHIDLLGMTVKEVVTGVEGIVTCVSFDLYGCVQAVVTPPAKDGKGTWFDVTRLNILVSSPIMAPPDFERGYVSTGKKGGADKPLPGRQI